LKAKNFSLQNASGEENIIVSLA